MSQNSVIPFLRDFGAPKVPPSGCDLPTQDTLSTSGDDDFEGQLAAEFERGRMAGREEAEVDHKLKREEMLAQREIDLNVARDAWVAQESEKVAEKIELQFELLQRDLSNAICCALQPVLTQAVYDHAVESFKQTASELAENAASTMVLSGPADLVDCVAKQLVQQGIEISKQVTDGPELTLSVDETRVSTTLTKWVSAITGNEL